MAICQRAVGNCGLRRQVRAQEFDCGPHGGCGDGHAHQSRPLLDVYRGRGSGHQRNQLGGETKVTRSSVAKVPARWFCCWRFGRRGDLRASLRQNGIDLFSDLPRVALPAVAPPGATIVPPCGLDSRGPGYRPKAGREPRAPGRIYFSLTNAELAAR
jgi:hypothetical protein